MREASIIYEDKIGSFVFRQRGKKKIKGRKRDIALRNSHNEDVVEIIKELMTSNTGCRKNIDQFS